MPSAGICNKSTAHGNSPRSIFTRAGYRLPRPSALHYAPAMGGKAKYSLDIRYFNAMKSPAKRQHPHKGGKRGFFVKKSFAAQHNTLLCSLGKAKWNVKTKSFKKTALIFTLKHFGCAFFLLLLLRKIRHDVRFPAKCAERVCEKRFFFSLKT